MPCPTCEEVYQDPEEVLKEILCQVINLVNGSNIVEIETTMMNRKFCLVSDPSKEASVEIVRNEDQSFNSYKIHILDGSGTILTQQDLTGLTICEEDLGPILQNILASLQNIEGLVDQVEPLLTSLETLLTQNNQDNQTIITGIGNIISEVQNVVTTLVAEQDQTQALIQQGNTIAQAVLDYFNNNSCATPLFVQECNPIDLTGIQNTLSNILIEAQQANQVLSDIEQNTNDVESLIQQLIVDTQSILTEVQTNNTISQSILNSVNQLITQNNTIISELQSIGSSVSSVVTIAQSIDSKLSTTNTILQNEFDQTQALIQQGNVISQGILDYLNNNSCANPISVTVCNQVNLANIESSLSSMVSLLTDIRTSVQNLETESTQQTLLLNDQINRLDTIITLIQSGNTTLAQIQTEVNNVNQNLVIVTNFLDAIELDTTAILAQVTQTNSELQNTQTLLQNEFDQTQALISTGNTTLTSILTELQKVSREYEVIQVGGMLELDSTTVKTLADVVDNLNLATPNNIGVPINAVGVRAMVKGDPVFVTDNGLDPNGSGTFIVGECYEEDDYIFGGQEPRFDNQCLSDLVNMKFISSGSSYLQISFYNLK